MKIDTFAAELKIRLETSNFNSEQTDVIEKEIKSILEGYLIIKSNRKVTKESKTKNSYRVRYKVYDSENRIWIPKCEIREGLYAKEIKNSVLDENPGCRVSSVWLLSI